MLLLWLALPLAFIALVIGLSVGGKSITVGLNGMPSPKIVFSVCVYGTGCVCVYRAFAKRVYWLKIRLKLSQYVLCVCTLAEHLYELSERNPECVHLWLVRQAVVRFWLVVNVAGVVGLLWLSRSSKCSVAREGDKNTSAASSIHPAGGDEHVQIILLCPEEKITIVGEQMLHRVKYSATLSLIKLLFDYLLNMWKLSNFRFLFSSSFLHLFILYPFALSVSRLTLPFTVSVFEIKSQECSVATISLCFRYKRRSLPLCFAALQKCPRAALLSGKEARFTPRINISLVSRSYPDTINPAFRLFLALKMYLHHPHWERDASSLCETLVYAMCKPR